jgi:sugar/nucleoside kinase (ribokinase family)
MSGAGRVVVLGDLMVDIVASASVALVRGSDAPASVRTHGGGSAANVAAWLAAAGVPVALLARAGDDPAGRAARDELAAGGVDVRIALDPARATGTCVVVVEPGGERTFSRTVPRTRHSHRRTFRATSSLPAVICTSRATPCSTRGLRATRRGARSRWRARPG